MDSSRNLIVGGKSVSPTLTGSGTSTKSYLVYYNSIGAIVWTKYAAAASTTQAVKFNPSGLFNDIN